MKRIVILAAAFLFCRSACPAQAPAFSHADTLLGSGNAHRAYHVLHYDLSVTPDYNSRSITGSNRILFQDSGLRYMQIDLQEPMQIDSIRGEGRNIAFQRDGNTFLADLGDEKKQPPRNRTITVYFQGHPQIAAKPPWDGGWVFTKDRLGRPWMSVACEENGASLWYPCKDDRGDEPDSGVTLAVTVPDSLMAVGNGRLKATRANGDGTSTWTWVVSSPINNYNIVPYIGKYKTWRRVYRGEKGNLDTDFWVLDYQEDRAKQHFTGVDSMLRCFEYWLGPYPFYEDSYKLVEAPYLGMEHQSNIAYGNHFRQGYEGQDLSETGWGMKWDFIVVHESGHEWFGNNISAKDIADEWIHEAFTDYSECLYTGYYFGRAAGDAYVIGLRKKIENKFPIIRYYGVHHGPEDTDEYYKGSNMIHIIRQVMNNDSLFREMLRGMNRVFYHSTVTSADIENYINRFSGRDFTPLFDQYLRTAQVPVFEYRQRGGELEYRWSNCIPGFRLPLKINFGGPRWVSPTTAWQKLKSGKGLPEPPVVDPNFYVAVKNDAEPNP